MSQDDLAASPNSPATSSDSPNTINAAAPSTLAFRSRRFLRICQQCDFATDAHQE